MAEEWRKKGYYGPRVLIETGRITSPQLDAILICLTGPQVEMLRNLTQYLHRRSTFAQDYEQDYYLAPNNEDWEVIETIVAELEGNLMSDCLNDLIVAIEAQTAVIDAMMQCVCTSTAYQQNIASQLPGLSGYVDQTLVNYLAPGETEGNPINPATDTEKCELAQAMYYYIYDAFTEDILPFANASADTLTGLIVATSTFALLGGFLGLPVVILGYVVSGVVAWAIDGAISSIINWLLAIKDEYVCVLYNAYPDYALASQGASTLIDDDGTLSYLEKNMLKSLMASSWHMTWVSKDQQTNGTWDSYFIAGQCDDCVPPDPECQTLDCAGGNWGDIPPGVLACESGTPYALNAFPIRWLGGSPTQPAAGFKLQVNWTAMGASGNAILGCDLRSDVTEHQINVSPPASQPVGETTTSEWTLSSPGTIGEGLDIRLAQATWYGLVNWYCIRPL